jgi:hypothetical protein
VTEPNVSQQTSHIAGAEGFSNLPLRFRHVEGCVFTRRNSCGVLPAVLQKRQCVIDLLIDGR